MRERGGRGGGRRVETCEVRVEDPVDQVRCQLRRDVLVGRDREGQLADDSRQVRAEFAVTLGTRCGTQSGGRTAVDLDAALLGDPGEDPVELIVGTGADVDLVVDPPEEGLVAQPSRVEVRGEHDLHLEGHFELPAVQRQVVDLAVQRHDPAIEERIRGHGLSTEVVDDQDAAVRLHLQGCEVDAGVAVELQVEHPCMEFPSGDHGRASALHPTAVQARRLLHGGFVQRRVEHRDDLSVDLETVRDQDVVLVRPHDPLRHAGLPGTRWAVEEHRTPAVDGGAELVEQRRRDHQVRERLGQHLLVQPYRWSLVANHGGVQRQRHGHRACVAGLT